MLLRSERNHFYYFLLVRTVYLLLTINLVNWASTGLGWLVPGKGAGGPAWLRWCLRLLWVGGLIAIPYSLPRLGAAAANVAADTVVGTAVYAQTAIDSAIGLDEDWLKGAAEAYERRNHLRQPGEEESDWRRRIGVADGDDDDDEFFDALSEPVYDPHDPLDFD